MTTGSVVTKLGPGMSVYEKEQLFGDAEYTQAPYASMVWSGPTYSPNVGLTRLKVSSDGRLVSETDTHGIVTINSGSNSAYFTIPTSGIYSLVAVQAFGVTSTAQRACGLCTSSTDANIGRRVWADIAFGRLITAVNEVYLSQGTVLYPWVYVSASGSNMTSSDTGMVSRYSVRFVHK